MKSVFICHSSSDKEVADITVYDTRHSTKEEERFQIIGMSRMVRELTVCHCVNDENTVTRIISARRATKREIELYERGI